MSADMKQFDWNDRGIDLVNRSSNLDPSDDDPGVWRAVLSCGHVTGADTLTDCCKAQLSQGQTYFECPLCKKIWSYVEVRKLAKLTADERLYFERTLTENTMKKMDEVKTCPQCRIYCKRTDFRNLSVECSVCTARSGKVYEFCWQCNRTWKGPRPRSDRCDNTDCSFSKLDVLRNCSMVTLKNVENIECPSVRACPYCRVLIRHTGDGCKIMVCENCSRGFCFVCLKPAEYCAPRNVGNFKRCRDGIAPRQAII